MLSKVVALGVVLGAFAVTGMAQTFSNVSVRGQLKACDASQLDAAMAQRSLKSSVPVGVKKAVSMGQPVATLSGNAVEVQVMNAVYTQKDQRGLFGMHDSLLIGAGDRCDATPFTIGDEQLMQLRCTDSARRPGNIYYMSVAGQFCNVAYHINQFTGQMTRQDVSSVADTPNAMAMYHSNVRTVVVFIDGIDGRLRFEVRDILPGGAIGRTEPYEFDAASAIGGDPITVGPLNLKILRASSNGLTYQVVRAN